MATEPLPCDREEPDELSKLRMVLHVFEDLMEECMSGPLTPEDQKILDDLYAYLLLEEERRWLAGAPPEMTSPLFIESLRDYIEESSEVEFPMIYFALGLQPEITKTRSFA